MKKPEEKQFELRVCVNKSCSCPNKGEATIHEVSTLEEKIEKTKYKYVVFTCLFCEISEYVPQ